jgi:hypothetical protein
MMLLFMYSTVYAIRFGTSIPRVFPYDMFRPDGAIFRYVQVVVQSPSFCYSPPQWPVFTQWGCVVYVLFVCLFFCQVYCFWNAHIVKSLNFCITPRVKLVKIYVWSSITILLKYFFSQLIKLYI